MCGIKTTILSTATPSGDLKFTFQYRTVNIKDVLLYVEQHKFNELCKSGCLNYGKKWSCPPFTPSFEQYTNSYKYLSVCVLSINLSQFFYIKNDYLKVKAANIILKSRIDKVLRFLSQYSDSYISTGSCRLCNPCKCKMHKECAKPDIMSYSFEALGVDVDFMVMSLFQHKLLWYKKGNLPEYTSVVAGLLSDEIIDDSALLNTLKKYN